MTNHAGRPTEQEYAPHYATYINKVKGDDLLAHLIDGEQALVAFIESVPHDRLDYRYQEGKWNIKEILVHLIDAERIFSYRALRFARNDKAELAGFDENDYVPESDARNRALPDIIREYKAMRQATIELYKSFSDEVLLRKGKASGYDISVRALGYTIAGHEIHHAGVIRERYL